MIHGKKLSTILITLTLLFLVTSCAGLKLDPPSPDKQTILVLPVQVTNKSQTGRHGFYYIYEIKKAGDRSIAYEAIFKLPIKGDMLIVDTLPPGSYFVDKFIFKPIGAGDFTYGNNVQSRHDKFKLVSGKITIFSKSLDVLLFNRIPGRGRETTYEFKMLPLSPGQKEKTLTTLKELPNFESWEILDTEAKNEKKTDHTIELRNMPAKAVCFKAVIKTSDAITWDTSYSYDRYSKEAKRRGYTPEKCAALLEEQLEPDPIS